MKYLTRFLSAQKSKDLPKTTTIKTIETYTGSPCDGFDGSHLGRESQLLISFDGFDGSINKQFLENRVSLAKDDFTEIAIEPNHQNHRKLHPVPFSSINFAALFANHCKRDGEPLQPDGSCNLCRQPLPF